MNWFEPVFQNNIGLGSDLFFVWSQLCSAFWGYMLASAIRPGLSLGQRLLIGVLTAVFWDILIPLEPLRFVGGRIGGLQNEVFLVLGLIVSSAIIILCSFRKFRFRALVPAIAALMVGSLSYTYHLVFANGLDAADRYAQAQELASLVGLSEQAMAEICTLETYECGQGFPATGHHFFDNELKAWIEALPPDARGAMSSSNGAVNTNPTYVWAALISDDGVRWIRKSYEDQTRALTLAFGIMLVLASAFWFSAAIVVEILHERQWRHKKIPTEPTAN